MKIGICGICGRMGQEILDVVLQKNHELGAAFDSRDSLFFGREVSAVSGKNVSGIRVSAVEREAVENCGCVIDFSSPEATMELLPVLIRTGRSLVIGTTGYSEEQKKRIVEASTKIPVVWSPSMSVGVNILFKLTEIASRAMNEDIDVEIFEAHHRFKKDAPSGTANKLLEIVKGSMPGMADAKAVYGREGFTGERSSKEIGMMSMRAADIVGEHTVFMAGEGERLELTVRSSNRSTYARGSVLAAEYLEGKGPGLYNMFDVLGL